ncbi:glycosyltransferase [Pseudoduganella sp. GCM10020061]|uniref:glycosyltransferase n=1 Tax=Pseudoduganella sp. GCM10020061 TaxID=3317345 RepID=UPI00363BEA21
MRIVIDFESCTCGLDPQALGLALELARTAGSGEVLVAVSSDAGDLIPALRHGLGGALPRESVRVYSLPAERDAGTGLRALLREHFLAALAPDCVLLPRAGGAAPSALLPNVVAAAPADTSAVELWKHLRELPPVAPPAPGRPRLAYVSPLPPEHSGIADYSAELVPELARYYDVELVIDQDAVSDLRLAHFPQHRIDWFEDNADSFDRVVYHFGNSHFHKHMFALLRRHPGIVVLHDFFLSGVLDNLEREGYLPGCFLEGLYESHGYTAILEHRRDGRVPAIWKYPLNKGVLDNADGVIVHSPFSVLLGTEWYGADAVRDWRVVPLLRGKSATHQHADARRVARERLGFKPDDFVVCSFGMLGITKLNEELLDAFLASPLGRDPHCRLVFVGQNASNNYGITLEYKIGRSSASKRIRITGFVDPATYADYLAASDCAVQLRSKTRGETSASVLDCLLFGIPTIVNAHGSTASLDPRTLVMLPDQFETGELADALARVRAEPELRAQLSARATELMQEHHAPAHVGALYRDAIETFAGHGRFSRYRRLLRDVARSADTGSASLPALAAAIALNQPATGPRQLLVDVSALVESDLRTGIQRVVRSVVQELISNPPPGYRVEPVFSYGGNRSYQYARRYTLGALDEHELLLEDAPVELRAGDIFLGLDLFTNGTAQNHQLLQSMRNLGVEVVFVVYDLLPVLRPDVFPFGTEHHFTEFLNTATTVSDGIVCISRAVADELCGWIATHRPPRPTPLQVGWFHLGADIDASAPSAGLPPNAAHVFTEVAARPSFLMVGTVEPRKGHAQALAAFERLWAQGVDVNLVIVGKQGWMVDKLCDQLASHPEKDKRLFWLAGVSDEMLLKLYAASAALLAPSEGEGFGLPLIEAAQHNIPIIARRLPVFQEVAGEHAYYFDGLEPHHLSDAVAAWLELYRAGSAPASAGMRWLTWSDSTRQLLDAVVRKQWYRLAEGKQA